MYTYQVCPRLNNTRARSHTGLDVGTRRGIPTSSRRVGARGCGLNRRSAPDLINFKFFFRSYLPPPPPHDVLFGFPTYYIVYALAGTAALVLGTLYTFVCARINKYYIYDIRLIYVRSAW